MTIVNDNSRVVNKLEASLADNARVVIYDRHRFIAQATEEYLKYQCVFLVLVFDQAKGGKKKLFWETGGGGGGGWHEKFGTEYFKLNTIFILHQSILFDVNNAQASRIVPTLSNCENVNFLFGQFAISQSEFSKRFSLIFKVISQRRGV